MSVHTDPSRKTSKVVALLLGCVLALVVPLLATGHAAAAVAGAPAARAEPMTLAQAKDWYLGGECTYLAAGNKYSRFVWGNRSSITRDEVRRRLPEIRKAARPYAYAVFRFSRRMTNPPAAWPEDLAYMAGQIADLTYKYAVQVKRQSLASTAAEWSAANKRINKIYVGKRREKIRILMNMPASPRGC